MRITIVVDDKLVLCDSFPVNLPGVDWSKFAGDPGSPFDDIHAVQFNSERGQGHIEYKEVETRQAARANIKPPDMRIGQAEFDAEFAWILAAYNAERDRLAANAEQARAAAEKASIEAEAQAAEARRLAIEKASLPQSPDDAPSTPSASAVDVEQLKAALAEQTRMNAETKAKLDALVSDVAGAVNAGGTP